MSARSRIAVLHAACQPVTGPWSVMRDLARAQRASDRHAAVGIAVVHDAEWPEAYREEARAIPLPLYESACPDVFGTALFLHQYLRPPPWRRWIEDLAARAGTDRVVLHLHNAWMSGVFLPLPRIPGIRVGVVATFHGVNEHFDGKPVRRAIHRWMARRLVTHGARLTSVDLANTEVAERIFGIPRAAFSVIPNGIDPTPSRARPGAGIPGRPLALGHVGSMIEQKGWRLLAEAAERINRGGIRVRVVLAGRGLEEERAAEWARRHAEWAEYRGFAPNPREGLMPGLDALCLMSRWEGLPMAIVEAMSVGLPVIATDVGGVSEAVQPGRTGWLVPRTADALAAVIEDILRDPARLAALGEAGRRRFEDRFTLDRVAEGYATVYDGALA